MTPETLRELRVNLLLQLRAAGRLGLGKNELLLGLKTAGFRDAKADTVEEEIGYLTDKEQVAKVDQEISPEVESFRITAAGRDWLAQQNY